MTGEVRRWPGVIVVGVDTPIGLTVVRELGERGVPVYGVARSREAIGSYSRRIAGHYLRPREAARLPELLARITDETGAALVMAISEPDLLSLREAGDAGRLKGHTLLIPTMDKLRIVGDKVRTYEAAKEAGVPLPLSWQPGDGPSVALPPGELRFPCVLKWRDPEAVRGELARCDLPLLKSEYCYTAADLVRALGRYSRVARYPLVQEFCPGLGLGHMVFLHDGKPLLRFQHRRLAEWPPEGGSSTVCRSLSPAANAELFEKSVALLQRIGWEGAAMVEYRFDERTGQAALMEINGRFWGSLPLAYHAGAPFAWLTYAVLGLGLTPELAPYKVGLTCRYMIPETRRLCTVLFRPEQIQDRSFVVSRWTELRDYLAAFFAPRTRYYVFAWNDPLPFLADMMFVLGKAAGRVISALRSKAAPAGPHG